MPFQQGWVLDVCVCARACTTYTCACNKYPSVAFWYKEMLYGLHQTINYKPPHPSNPTTAAGLRSDSQGLDKNAEDYSYYNLDKKHLQSGYRFNGWMNPEIDMSGADTAKPEINDCAPRYERDFRVLLISAGKCNLNATLYLSFTLHHTCVCLLGSFIESGSQTWGGAVNTDAEFVLFFFKIEVLSTQSSEYASCIKCASEMTCLDFKYNALKCIP